MEMDAICWMDIVRHATSRDLLHIGIAREVFLHSIDIHGEVRMVVDYIWTRYEEKSDYPRETYTEEGDEYIFHSGLFFLFMKE